MGNNKSYTTFTWQDGARFGRLFNEYNFKDFAKAVRRVDNKFSGKMIRELYSGYRYPELPFYLEITENIRND